MPIPPWKRGIEDEPEPTPEPQPVRRRIPRWKRGIPGRTRPPVDVPLGGVVSRVGDKPPTKEYTPAQLSAMSKLRTGRAISQWGQEKRRYDPLKTYMIPNVHLMEGGKGYRVVFGEEVLFDIDKQFSRYWKGQVGFQKELGSLDPRMKLKETKTGYETLPLPTRTTLITKKFESKHWLEQKAAEVFSPIVQLPANIINLFGMGQTQKEWIHPDTGYHYLKEDLIIGYAPVTTYYDPITGERYSMKDKKFTKVDAPLIGFAEMTHKMPTLMDKPMSYTPWATPEMKQRASWVTKRVSSDPSSILTMGAGEVASLWGFGQVLKPVGKVLSPYISKAVHSPVITKPIIRLTSGMRRGFGGISTKVSPYLPSTIKTGYRGLFRTVTPGSFTKGRVTVSTMLDSTTRYTSVVGSKPLQLHGGVVSRFMYYSPQRFGLSGIATKPIIGASIITSRGAFKGMRWSGKDLTRGWGILKGFTIERLTTFKRYYPWSKGGNIYQPGQWFSKKAIGELQKVGTTRTNIGGFLTGKGFGIEGISTTLGKPYRFPFTKIDVTSKHFVMGYRNIDEIIPNLMKSLHPVDYSFFGMGKIIKPTVMRGGVSLFEKPLTPVAWTGATTQLRGFAPEHMGKAVSQRYLDWLDFLEPSYKSVSRITPHHFPKIYLQPKGLPKGGVDVLSGLVGAKLVPTVYGESLFSEPKGITKHRRKLRFESYFDKLAYAPVKGMGLTTGLITGSLPGSKSAQKMMQGTMQGLSQQQIFKSLTSTTSKDDFSSYSTPIKLPLIPAFSIPITLYGRGKKGWPEEGVIPGYRYREHKIGTLSKDIDKMLKSFGLSTRTTKRKRSTKKARSKKRRKKQR